MPVECRFHKTLRYPVFSDVLPNMVADSLTLGFRRKNNAILFSERPVPKIEHEKIVALLDRVHWDDLNVFRDVARFESMRQASKSLKLPVNTIRARISRLEQDMKTQVIVRERQGLRLTPEGIVVLEIADQMRAVSAKLPVAGGRNALVKEGEIRICVSEGLATFWLTSKLEELKRLLPNHVVLLDSFSNQRRLKPVEYDVSVGFLKPADQEAIVSKIGMAHILPYASENYLRRFGFPHSVDQLSGHHCVQQTAPGMNYDFLKHFLGTDEAKRVVKIKVSSSFSLFWAVASGNGIGAMPTYMSALSDKILPLPLPIQLKFEVLMSYNKVARDTPVVRTALDWIRDSFNPQRYPWFRDEFIHPDEFELLTDGAQISLALDDLIDVTA